MGKAEKESKNRKKQVELMKGTFTIKKLGKALIMIENCYKKSTLKQ